MVSRLQKQRNDTQRCLANERARLADLKIENDRLRSERDAARVKNQNFQRDVQTLNDEKIQFDHDQRAQYLKMTLMERALDKHKGTIEQLEKDKLLLEDRIKESVKERDSTVEKFKSTARDELKREMESHVRSVSKIVGVTCYSESSSSESEDEPSTEIPIQVETPAQNRSEGDGAENQDELCL